ncbi:hypothetical protein MTO96_013679 [Rhipicephalus appendiculatus]
MKASGILHLPSNFLNWLDEARAGAGLATSSGGSASTTASLTTLFDRQQSKRKALRCALLEAGRKSHTSVGSPSRHRLPGTDNLPPLFGLRQWHRLGRLKGGPTFLPAALSATLQWLLDARESHAAAQRQASVASVENCGFASSSINSGSIAPT